MKLYVRKMIIYKLCGIGRVDNTHTYKTFRPIRPYTVRRKKNWKIKKTIINHNNTCNPNAINIYKNVYFAEKSFVLDSPMAALARILIVIFDSRLCRSILIPLRDDHCRWRLVCFGTTSRWTSTPKYSRLPPFFRRGSRTGLSIWYHCLLITIYIIGFFSRHAGRACACKKWTVQHLIRIYNRAIFSHLIRRCLQRTWTDMNMFDVHNDLSHKRRSSRVSTSPRIHRHEFPSQVVAI